MFFLRRLLLVGILPFILSGCFVVNLFDFGPSIDLGKNQWKISAFILEDEKYTPIDFEEVPYLRFDTVEFKVYGNTGCNTFFANYVWVNDKTIEMRNSGLTRRMCASEEAMKFEQKLMEEFDGEFEVIEDKEKNTLILKKPQLEIILEPLKAEESK